MADIVDQAQQQAECLSESFISHIRDAANRPIPTSETCYFCLEATNGGRRWCDLYCQKNWLAKKK
jgi:hypothetical protein